MSGHLDGPPPGPPDPPYIPGDLGAPSAEEFARRRASSEPRPENPTRRIELALREKVLTYVLGLPDVLAVVQPEIDRLEAERASFEAVVNVVINERNVARAERDAALAAGQKLADLVTLLGGYDGPATLRLQELAQSPTVGLPETKRSGE